MNKQLRIGNSFMLVVMRLIVVYLLMTLCRVVFYINNMDLIGSFTLSDLSSIFKGGFVYDSASIFYVNLPFITLSLLPFYFRETRWWQRIVAWVYVVLNSAALLVNVMDIFYYPYKLSRIASDDLRYASEENIFSLLTSFMGQFWWGVVMYVLFVALLAVVGFYWIRYRKGAHLNSKTLFYISQTGILVLSIGLSIWAIRGFTMSKASFPIAMNDVTAYVEPQYSSLTLSNPFCLIRTLGKGISAPSLTTKEQSETLFSPEKKSDGQSLYKLNRPNIVLIVLESFGAAHIKALSDDISNKEDSYTPFLDSLFEQGLLMTNAYQSTRRSIDVLPALWASIPSYKRNLLSHPQAITSYHTLPHILKDEQGYKNLFLHGSVSKSMSFKAFGEMAGIDEYFFQEDYEAMHGKGDFDGKWGIWDDKFLPFAAEQLNKQPQPFFATILTLTSHNPFTLPESDKAKYAEGKLPIHKTLRYTDASLREFFESIKSTNWYTNTLFIITADHTEGAVTEKWQRAPYSRRVPLFFYTPSGAISAMRDARVSSHVDLLPTILGMLNIESPYFGYGANLFSPNNVEGHFVVHYNSEVFDVVTNRFLLRFDDNNLLGIYDYRNDPLQKKNLKNSMSYSPEMIFLYKSYIQNYYTRLSRRSFTNKSR